MPVVPLTSLLAALTFLSTLVMLPFKATRRVKGAFMESSFFSAMAFQALTGPLRQNSGLRAAGVTVL